MWVLLRGLSFTFDAILGSVQLCERTSTLRLSTDAGFTLRDVGARFVHTEVSSAEDFIDVEVTGVQVTSTGSASALFALFPVSNPRE